MTHAAEVAAVGLARLEVQMLEDVQDVIPVLHEERIGLVYYGDLNRGEEVVVLLFLAVRGGQTTGVDE